jgi:subtilisin family serine protease
MACIRTLKCMATWTWPRHTMPISQTRPGGPKSLQDDFGHGTHVAGIIAGEQRKEESDPKTMTAVWHELDAGGRKTLRTAPLEAVLSDFGTAVISAFDLQPATARQASRYAVPETIVGTCSAASDWWSRL